MDGVHHLSGIGSIVTCNAFEGLSLFQALHGGADTIIYVVDLCYFFT